MTYFDKGMFGWLELKINFYQHFGSDPKWDRVREARISERGSNGELKADRLIEVSCFLRFIPLFYTLVILIANTNFCLFLAFSLGREGELSLKAYKHKVQASHLQIVKY